MRILPILPEPVYRARDLIESLPEYSSGNFHVLASVLLSAFLDPKAFKGSQRDLVYTRRVDLVVTTSPPNARPILVVDVIRSGRPDTDAELSRLFSKLSVRYLTTDPDAVANAVKENLHSLPASRNISKSIIKQTEWDAAAAISRNLANLEMEYFPEIAVLDALELGEGDKKKVWQMAGEAKRQGVGFHADYLSTTAFDGLITTRSPYAIPLVAVEVDGSIHDVPNKQAKDGVKDFVCREAGLPLVRLRVDGGSVPPDRRLMIEYIAKAAAIQQKQSAWFASNLVAFMREELRDIDQTVEMAHLSRLMDHMDEAIKRIPEARHLEYVPPDPWDSPDGRGEEEFWLTEDESPTPGGTETSYYNHYVEGNLWSLGFALVDEWLVDKSEQLRLIVRAVPNAILKAGGAREVSLDSSVVQVSGVGSKHVNLTGIAKNFLKVYYTIALKNAVWNQRPSPEEAYAKGAAVRLAKAWKNLSFSEKERRLSGLVGRFIEFSGEPLGSLEEARLERRFNLFSSVINGDRALSQSERLLLLKRLEALLREVLPSQSA